MLHGSNGGDIERQRNLGGLYGRGEGVERDEGKATAWYLRAAGGGEADAQFFTAQRYRSGKGHDAPNMKEAVKWYQKAALQGHCDAQLELERCCHEGNGVKNNPGFALKLWRKCAQHLVSTLEPLT